MGRQRPGRVRHHVVDSPAHVGLEGCAKFGIGGQFRVIERVNEAVEEPLWEIAHVAVPGMQRQDTGLVTAAFREGRRPAHHLGPVGSETFDVLGMLISV
jgi:hypothetical protein